MKKNDPIGILNDAKNRLEETVGQLTGTRTRVERTIALLKHEKTTLLGEEKLTEIFSTLTPYVEQLNLMESNMAILYQALRERLAELGEA
ncbi:MAG: hypothetical protein LBO09_06135 [Candidatus Peribacteria bacterium]|jgi:hypothetical protein|nr:hypothetical protein [Candidatus Peribacteria bacterium]